MTHSGNEVDMEFAELIDHFRAQREGEFLKFELLGIGFTGSDGAEGERFSFGGVDFYFGSGDCFRGFVDVRAGYHFHDEIYWMGENGSLQGEEDGPFRTSFRPLNQISREAMAALMYRWAGKPDFKVPEFSPFVDVATDHAFYQEMA